MKQSDTYKEVKTFHYDNAVVRVHIPELTAEERERRKKEISKAAGILLTSERKSND